MDKEREIEEMASAISKSCEEQIEKNRCASLRCEMCMAEFMNNAGYRKADEVRKETANSMYNYFKELRWHFDDWQWAAIYTACKAHGAEVGE